MRFCARAWTSGKIATGIAVQAEVVDCLGRGKRPPVCVTINPRMYRGSAAPVGGEPMVGISELREGPSEV
jgi:hypothetical protein